MNTKPDGVSAMSAELGPLPEPLFLLHTGDLFGNERDEWEVQANSGKAVDELAKKQPPGATLGLYDEHTVRQLVAAERERCAIKPLTRQQIDDVMTHHYPLDSLLKEDVDRFEVCVRDIERRLGIGA